MYRFKVTHKSLEVSTIISSEDQFQDTLSLVKSWFDNNWITAWSVEGKMSDPSARVQLDRKKVKMTEQICVFCMNLVNDYVCHECNDYKGLMPVRDAKQYLGSDFPEEYLELV